MKKTKVFSVLKSNSKLNKKALKYGMIATITASLLVLMIYMIFFGSGIFKEIRYKIINLTDLPDQDPTIWQEKTYKNRGDALKQYAKTTSAMEQISKSKSKVSNDLCFATMDLYGDNKDFFYKGFVYQMEKRGEDTLVKLWQYKEDNTDSDDQEKAEGWTMIETIVLEKTNPCIIQGESAVRFNQYILQNDKNIIDESKLIINKVFKLTLRDEANLIFVGEYNTTKDKKYNFYPGDEVNKRIIMKYKNNICLMPTSSDPNWFTQGDCDGVKDGLIDDDCFDYDNAKGKLPFMLQNTLKDYVCEGFEESINNIEVK
ncbi:hypothetical protein K9L67_03680 [Candidatus Woesearchaeota archaeon]|nr:hypothetical protein [Candidatus Woesearchaeota archaeon]MCF7901302.1 hypothetical protein [Candidatus Woesearchaeota archaeon]MCF8013792.1 hypothetical protein [Candidatus Woesearchaeota archaeon]